MEAAGHQRHIAYAVCQAWPPLAELLELILCFLILFLLAGPAALAVLSSLGFQSILHLCQCFLQQLLTARLGGNQRRKRLVSLTAFLFLFSILFILFLLPLGDVLVNAKLHKGLKLIQFLLFLGCSLGFARGIR